MARKAECLITSSVEGKGAYGVTTDTDENVYFPFGLTEHMGLEEFERVEAILVKNDRPEPPWKAIKVRRLDDDGDAERAAA